MKIFLSSTAYDLLDFRAKIVEVLSKNGHEVIFHESPTFPAKIDLHSHDQCLLAIEDCQMVLCIIDKRYGGKYSGDLLKKDKSFKFTISGFNAKGERLKEEIEMTVDKMSITWCELERAYSLNKNVITFCRQRTLDEKETRRHNQYLKTFRPAYAEKNDLFDLIDWITKQRRNNWIVPYSTIVDFEEKLKVYIDEYDKLKLKTTISKKYTKNRICIIVEGEIDRVVVQTLIRKSKIQGDFVIIPSYGKYRIVQNANDYIKPFAETFDQVIVLVDTDAKNPEQFETFKKNSQALLDNLIKPNVHFYGANPEIESWIIAGINEDLYRQYEGYITKEIFKEFYEAPTIDNVRAYMRKFNIAQALQLSDDMQLFVSFLRDVAFMERN